jgi:hypothetical protein
VPSPDHVVGPVCSSFVALYFLNRKSFQKIRRRRCQWTSTEAQNNCKSVLPIHFLLRNFRRTVLRAARDHDRAREAAARALEAPVVPKVRVVPALDRALLDDRALDQLAATNDDHPDLTRATKAAILAEAAPDRAPDLDSSRIKKISLLG